ncbi:hydrolase [Pantoea alhagi]|uniref:Hydrolase n=1 Tax=Pantoea alhagi TaxID=1891675 RepID=A0A1W6BAL9_9GAMM|nr:metal-dependent hydrolase [Pantoea alhagi]ARJ44124.1 hydrolase [Pantoea alhagi]
MDSVSQLVLGASVGMAVMGRKAPLWKSALVGGFCGTLPDLDVFLDHGDAIRNMTLHRTESHALVWLTLLSPLLAWLLAGVVKQRFQWIQWWPAVWLALITHPLLDLMTVYGTQLGLPFTDYPWAIGSIYIVDPLYTLPLIICLIVALWRREPRWSRAGLALSTGYLLWSMAAQGIALYQVAPQVAHQLGVKPHLLVTPTAFNTLVWRVVAVTPERYYEGYWSLLAPHRPLQLSMHDRGAALYQQLKGDPHVERVAWFSHGFFAMQQRDGKLFISDLRMGEAPDFTFTFDLGAPQARNLHPSRLASSRPSLAQTWRHFRQRL